MSETLTTSSRRHVAIFTVAVSALCLVSISTAVLAAGPAMPFDGSWQTIGRASMTQGQGSVTIANGYVAELTPLADCEMSFRARALPGKDPVQIWGAIRVKDRDSRYVFGLRGGAEPQLSLARYAPDGNAKFLGFAPLDFIPVAGQWYRLRVAVSGNRFQVYLNDEKLPRLNVQDVKGALWTEGGIGLGGGWLPTEFADLRVSLLAGERLAAFQAVGDQLWQAPAVDKEALRAQQRAAYQPAKITSLPATRGEFPLAGNWLFMPEQTLPAAATASAPEFADQGWHVIPVPSLWTPALPWLHGENGLPDLKGLQSSKGPSDQLQVEEYARVKAQTFDWDKTRIGWYRHHLELPQNVTGRQFNLVFDAIAKISDVWVNGVKVGSNVGMFRELNCDISQAVKPGSNVIAVRVIGNPDGKIKDASKVEAVAVSVNVTNEMIQSLPHGMTDNSSRGIWQPVKLVVTNPLRVGELFIQPRLDGAAAEVEILNSSSQARTVTLAYQIRDLKDQSVLDADAKPVRLTVPPRGRVTATIATPKLQPKLWSPQVPNLYVLDLVLSDGRQPVDRLETRFGFRTFTVDGPRFLLNGKPYWLRGGNHTPATLRPNDGALARRFIQLAREGNVWITRSHALPFTTAWLDAADETGMGVSYEGTWPWLMIKGEPPAADLLNVWKDEFAALLRKHRNHPSLLLWTVNNEMNFGRFDEKDPELLKRKWIVLDDMIRTMRQIDPTRPISAYSGYAREEARKGFKEVVEPNHFDDGDIDDAHVYYGWYNPSFMHLLDGQFGKHAVPNRPLISQEISTGYPRNDDWPSRSYQFTRYVPQALVGNDAFEQNDPVIFMTRQALMTKEGIEVIRRTNRNECAGLLPFAYLTWFTDVWKADKIRPKLTYFEVKKAMQAVLVSAELGGRHFYAGEAATRRVCLVNDADDQQAVPAGKLSWEIRDGATVLAQGSQATAVLPYYSNQWLDVDLRMPATLPRPRVDAKLVITLTASGRTIAANDYDLLLATRQWTRVAGGAAQKFLVYDPAGRQRDVLAGVKTAAVSSLDPLQPGDILIMGDLGAWNKSADGPAKLKAFVENGGKVLILQPGADLTKLLPEIVMSYRKTQGEIVSMAVAESPVFTDLQPLDMAWFEMGPGKLPLACGGTYEVNRSQPGVSTLAHECDIHVDLKPGQFFQIAGTPILEVRLGKGRLIASEMMLAAQARDPVAGRLLANMLGRLLQR